MKYKSFIVKWIQTANKTIFVLNTCGMTQGMMRIMLDKVAHRAQSVEVI